MPTRQLLSPDVISVLIAGADPIFGGSVAARIERMNGHAVQAEDGAVAWDLLMTQPFDVALVDLSMPGFDGLELIGGIRGHAPARHMPIVVITSHDDAATIAASLNAGATAFLTKPVNWLLFENHLNLLHSAASAERKQRTALQLVKATNRAKHVIVDGLSAQVRLSTLRARARLSEIRGLPVGSPAVADAIDDVMADLERLAAASKRASRFASILAHDVDASDQFVPLDELLEELIHTVAAGGAATANEIHFRSSVSQIRVRCDKESVQLAIGELLQNALAHSPPGQMIEITASHYPDGMLAVEVKDDGCGMHPDTVAGILGAGDPLSITQLTQVDMGFGLPLAKAIAQAHGGELEVRSMTGRGTSAVFLLPSDRVRLPAGTGHASAPAGRTR